MITLKEIYNKFDQNNKGAIDNIKFKRLINLLNLPLNNIKNKKRYTYDDLENYIELIAKKDIHTLYIKVEEFKKEFSKYINQDEIEYIIKKIYGNKNNDDKINISIFLESIDLFI